jgi:hypothetical protein
MPMIERAQTAMIAILITRKAKSREFTDPVPFESTIGCVTPTGVGSGCCAR